MSRYEVTFLIESTWFCRVGADDLAAARRWANREKCRILRDLPYLTPDLSSPGAVGILDSVRYRVTKQPKGPLPCYELLGGADLAAQSAPPYRPLQATPPTGRKQSSAHKRKQPPRPS